MNTFSIEMINQATLRVDSDDEGLLYELHEHFSFYVPGYKFMPLFRNRMWDGKVYLYNVRTKKLPFGLLGNLYQFAKTRKYEVKIGKSVLSTSYPDRSKESVLRFIDSLKLTSRGVKITPHDYQIEAVVAAIQAGRTICVSPTGSGKSLMIYIMLRWFLEFGRNDSMEKALVVVPTTGLVEQMKKDFIDYSQTDLDFNAAELVHQIYAGKEKTTNAPIVVTTWQSAITIKSRSWFESYGMVVGDEAHLFKAKSLTTIMDNLVNARYRIGTTGTLDGSLCNELVLTGAFGPVRKAISTKELIDTDRLAQLKINVVALKYPEIDRRAVRGMKYVDEISYLVFHERRNRFITKLAKSLKGNTLVIFNFVEKHGEPLYAMIGIAIGTERKAFFVAGKVGVDDRENIRTIVEKEKDAVIVASSGTFSTGVNLKNLHNIIFASPNKSQIRVLQTIGRGLRKADSGQATTVFDLADDLKLTTKSKPNFALSHAAHRLSIYEREQFEVATMTYEL
jgi:superfamily II DNA or RNA helicase